MAASVDGLPAPLQPFLCEAPEVSIVNSTVVHEDNHDIVLHTLKLECAGWTWYTTFHWAQIKSLQTSLTTWPWRRYFSRQPTGPVADKAPPGSTPSSPARSERNGRHEEPTPRRHQTLRTPSMRMGKASSKISLPHTLNDNSASRTDSVSVSQQKVGYELYLRNVLDSQMARTCPELLELLHVSLSSFDNRQGPSWREGYLSVRWWAHVDDEATGPGTMDEAEERLKSSMLPKSVLRPSVRRWAVLKNSFLALYKGRDDPLPEAVMLFDTDTALQGSLFEHGRLVVVNNVWRFELKARDRIDQRQWEASLRSVLARSPWVERSRFAYNRRLSTSLGQDPCCSLGQWYVDGEAAYKAIHAAILGARSQIFLTGPWVSPDLSLLRPPHRHPGSRLDRLLELKAQEGVHIYLLLFKEPHDMTVNSKYSKGRFNALDHRGHIHVLRTGNDLFPQMWCHHDNLVCVDQEVAFVGSVGLGLGKFDSGRHSMTDAGKVQTWPGMDYANPRVKDFVNVGHQGHDLPGHNRSVVPRMPVHGVHVAVTGFAAMDLCWHFISRWNLARYRCGKEGKVPTMVPLGLTALDPDYRQRQIEQQQAQQGSSTNTSTSSSLETQSLATVPAGGSQRGAFERHYGGPAAALPAPLSSTLALRDAGAGAASGRWGSIPEDDEFGQGFDGRREEDEALGGLSSVAKQPLGTTRKTIARLVFGSTSSVSEYPPRRADGQPADTASGLAEVASSKMKEALKSRREKNRQRLLELQHEIGIQSSELIFQGMMAVPEQPLVPGPMGGPLEWMEGMAYGGLEGEEGGSVDVEGEEEEGGRSLVPYAGRGRNGRREPRYGWGSATEAPPPLSPSEKEGGGRDLPSIGPMAPCRCHVVRSMGLWSGGYKEKQATILEAYEQLIDSAQHLVYIESPFFISGLQGDGVITNRIAEVIANRIARAHEERTAFRVVLVLPLLPTFDGSFQGAPLSTLTGALYWQHRSLHNLISRLAKVVPHPADYLLVLGLRQHAYMSGSGSGSDDSPVSAGGGVGGYGYDECSRLATEQIYVDSRTMIVDDKRAIIGTAAINERSLVGGRDSEVGVVLEDLQTVSSSMNGHPYSAGEFCHSLRTRLWAEHLGLTPDDERLVDPVATQTWELLRHSASLNSAIYQHTFPQALPSDSVRSQDMLKQLLLHGTAPRNHDVARLLGDGASEACKDDEQRAHWLKRLQGHVVTFPLSFLSDDMPFLQPTMVLADAST